MTIEATAITAGIGPTDLSAQPFVRTFTDDDISPERPPVDRYRNVRLLEPRTYGVILQKRF